MSWFEILYTFIAQVFRSIKEWLCPKKEEQFLSAQEALFISQLIENFELDATQGNSPVGGDYIDGGARQRRFKDNGDYRTMDLHSMTVKEAKDEVLNQLTLAKQDKCRTLNIITGKGIHSKDGIPKIKPAVIDLLRKEEAKNGRRERKLVHKFQEQPNNAGVQVVRIFRD